MKKLIVYTLTAVLAMGALAGCGGNETSGDNGTNTAGGSTFDAERDITVVSREDGSGTRGAFTELLGIEEEGPDGSTKDMTTDEAIIANKTDVMLTNVAGDEYGIGYVSLGSLSNAVKAVKVDGVEATAENIKNGTYKVSRPFNIATKDGLSEVAQDFIDFILSQEGQEVVSGDYIPVSEDAAPYAGTMPAGKIVVAGSSSVSPVMEKLKEAYLAVNTNATIEIQTNDSTAGMTAAIDGTCDIGMASRELKDSELEQLTPTQIALDGIAVIVNPENPVEDLSTEAIKDIFMGNTLTWSEVE